MRIALTYLFILCILLTGCLQSDLPDLQETYGSKETKPFGTYAAKAMIASVFPEKEIKTSKRAFAKSFENIYDTASIYINISRNFYLKDEDGEWLLDFVYSGNTALVVSSNFDSAFLASVHTKHMRFDAIIESMRNFYKETNVSISASDNLSEKYAYYYKPFVNYFSEINANNSRVYAVNESGRPNSYILFWGKGKLILHCDPRAFSNYFLLQKGNHKYLENFLKLTSGSPQNIYWDDYYRNQNVQRRSNKEFSAFSELMKHPPLAKALWLFIAVLLLYVFFTNKRKQRIIPVLKKNENSSVAFTETITRLYFQQKDNKNIAEKMITYFNEHIRNNYFLNVNSADLVSALSRKSGVSLEETKALFEIISKVNESPEISDEQLLHLNMRIQQFYKT